MSSTEPTYGILGVGAIATAIVRGPCEGVAEAPSVVLSPRNAERAAGLAAGLRSVRVASGNQAVVDASDVVIICLLPVDAADALAELDFRADQAVVSAVAGLPVVQLAELVAPATDVARSIPLPAVATRDSITPVASGDIRGNRTIPRGGRRDGARVRGCCLGDGRGPLPLPRHHRGLAGRSRHRYVSLRQTSRRWLGRTRRRAD